MKKVESVSVVPSRGGVRVTLAEKGGADSVGASNHMPPPDFSAAGTVPAGQTLTVNHGLGVVPGSCDVFQNPDVDVCPLPWDYDADNYYFDATLCAVDINYTISAWVVENH